MELGLNSRLHFYLEFMLAYKLCQETSLDHIYDIGPKLGDGADGEVFEIKSDPSKVIKFSVLYETNEPIKLVYDQISKTLNYLIENHNDTHARVFEYTYLGQYNRVTYNGLQEYILYSYTMEKLEKLSEDEKRVFHSLLSHEDREIKKDFSPKILQEMLTGMQRGLDFDLEKVKFFLNNYKKTKLNHNDLHPRNIMKDVRGNFRLIDFDRATLEKNNGEC